MVWYSHFFKSFPQFVMIHTVEAFSIVNETELGIFLEFLCSMIQQTLVIGSLVPLSYLNPARTSRSSQFMYC